MSDLTEKRRRLWLSPALVVGVLTATTFAVRLGAMLQTPHPLGADGYYYVTQATRAYLSSHLHTPDPSWVIYYLVSFRWWIEDPVVCIKVGASLLGALCVPCAWWVGRAADERHHTTHVQWLLAGWAAASPTLAGLTADFPKTAGMIPPGLLLLGFVLAGRRTLLHLLVMGACAILAMTAHRLGAVWLGLMLLGAGASHVLNRSLQSQGTRAGTLTRWSIVAGLTLVLFALLTWLVPGLLHPTDLERLHGQVDFSWGLPPPMAYFSLRPIHWVQMIELGATWVSVIAGVVLLVRVPAWRAWTGALVLCLVAFNFPWWRRDVLDLGYRLSLLAPVVAILVVCAVPGARRRFPFHHRGALALLGLAAVLLAMLATLTGINPRATPPYDRYRRVVERIPRPLPRRVIAHAGINFYYGHLTRHQAVAWAPDPALDRTQIFRLAWGIRDGEWLELASGIEDAPAPRRLDPSYTYVREDVWEELVRRAQEDGDPDLLERVTHWKNPGRQRPAFLRRKWRGRE